MQNFLFALDSVVKFFTHRFFLLKSVFIGVMCVEADTCSVVIIEIDPEFWLLVVMITI